MGEFGINAIGPVTVYTFAKDLPPDPEAIAARFAKMPLDRLKSQLEAARYLMRESKRETWKVQAELAAAEIEKRMNYDPTGASIRNPTPATSDRAS